MIIVHASKDALPVMLQAGPAQVRGVDWGRMRVGLVSVPAGTDFSPLLKGLPNDRCPGEHWGYVIKGRLHITGADGQEEDLVAGDFYHLPPGHTGIAEEDTDFIEIGEPGPHDEFLENARRNLAGVA
jgi:hypothetical protein